jgi:ABC-2 type transport system permease protein
MREAIGKSLVRVTSFVTKELREILRRPGVIATLVLGPFFVMALFGVGYTGARSPFQAEIVIPPGSELPRDQAYYEEIADAQLEIVRVSEDVEEARARLVNREVGLIVIAPTDADEQLRAGEQSVVRVEWNAIDPVRDNLAHFATASLVHEINSEIIERAAAEGLSLAEDELGQPIEVPPEVVARPTRAETENVSPSEPDVVNFFGPAVFALVLQHLAITLTALSMVRERLSGTMDVYRVAPVNSTELLIGKYLAYAFFSLIISAAVAALLIYVLGVPILGGILPFAGIVLLVTFASLGIGLLISLVADSEQQAVQLAMLVLLASVFFSGFVLPVEEFVPAVRWFAYLLPVTHGIETFQETMLRGTLESWPMLWALAAIGAVLYLISLLRLRRIVNRAE